MGERTRELTTRVAQRAESSTTRQRPLQPWPPQTTRNAWLTLGEDGEEMHPRSAAGIFPVPSSARRSPGGRRNVCRRDRHPRTFALSQGSRRREREGGKMQMAGEARSGGGIGKAGRPCGGRRNQIEGGRSPSGAAMGVPCRRVRERQRWPGFPHRERAGQAWGPVARRRCAALHGHRRYRQPGSAFQGAVWVSTGREKEVRRQAEEGSEHLFCIRLSARHPG